MGNIDIEGIRAQAQISRRTVSELCDEVQRLQETSIYQAGLIAGMEARIAALTKELVRVRGFLVGEPPKHENA